MKPLSLIAVVSLLAAAVLPAATDLAPFAAWTPRAIGPAGMSGRIGDIAARPGGSIYVGSATGGIWKSDNGGTTWEPVFDDQPTSSIGALAICPQDPSVVWAGTGEASPRNSAGVGRGLFRSLDGGRSWHPCGLEKTERIARIVVHPHRPDTLWVAATGATWGESAERGVFKTEDGGRSWKRVLFVDARSGCADLAIDPANPNHLVAAIWQHRRWPWLFQSGGPGSGLHVTWDGGASWKKLGPDDGLPAGELGRIGVAFAPGRPEVAYALVEAKKSVLLRSADNGRSWKTVNQTPGISDRPFYYADLRVNPRNENIVYLLQTELRASEDGGRSFRPLASFRQSHSDYHAMWLHPDGETMIVGNDGGVVISHDRGRSWRFAENLPLAQFYHVAVDDDIPYNVYGGFQDNGSWRGPSSSLTSRFTANGDWRMVGFGDGFTTLPDPADSSRGYCMSQAGYLSAFDLRLGLQRSIRPTETEVRHRYNWNAPLAIDPFDPAVLYYGSQFVHRSPDRGRTWEIISPDLTSNDPGKQRQAESGGLTRDVSGAENHTTLLVIAPSPKQRGLLWTGSDDGRIHVTRDGGRSWMPVWESLAGGGRTPVPAGSAVPCIEPSPHDPAVAYAVFDNHQRADWAPYLFVTRDYGRSWASLVTPQIDGFLHVLRQDPVNPDLLFLGSEFGLFVSLDGGRSWQKWRHGLPTVPVRDLVIQPRAGDLVIATHGRSAYILDDLTPLREWAAQPATGGARLFSVPDTVQLRQGWMPSSISPGDAVFQGANRPNGAIIALTLPPASSPATAAAATPAPPRLEILDDRNQLVRELKLPDKPAAGLLRVVWDLRRTAFRGPETGGEEGDAPWRQAGGLLVPPGAYRVRLKAGGAEIVRSFRVRGDPRLAGDEKGRSESHALALEIGGWLEEVSAWLRRGEKARQALRIVRETIGETENPALRAMREDAARLDDGLKEFANRLRSDPELQGFNDDSDLLLEGIRAALELVADAWEAPSQAARVKHARVKARLEPARLDAARLWNERVVPFQQELARTGFSLFPPEIEPRKEGTEARL